MVVGLPKVSARCLCAMRGELAHWYEENVFSSVFHFASPLSTHVSPLRAMHRLCPKKEGHWVATVRSRGSLPAPHNTTSDVLRLATRTQQSSTTLLATPP